MADVQMLPVIEAGALQLPVGYLEAQRVHHMQGAAGAGAQARDIAGVGRDLGLVQDDVKVGGIHGYGHH